ncbi:exported hypothetical protein [Candidatus Glomeribacter gigasporarum BEG34]|uniref:Uncharacterized protein n=1 Tax=Candidatus Glomeribacter gigasporarum BEG34 TaxID=1070319 RepID=G2JAC1_9BURK|nr:hypothetical protein [Candidatus Glomeribacter gigasporarum]CCD29722.1 exported hypothetical protein [Candidatus Glomeribacter gigasporarum BEG34]
MKSHIIQLVLRRLRANALGMVSVFLMFPNVFAGPVKTGYLEGGAGAPPEAISGVCFASPAATGFTDRNGAFQYAEDVPVQFSIGNVELGVVRGAPEISPFFARYPPRVYRRFN